MYAQFLWKSIVGNGFELYLGYTEFGPITEWYMFIVSQ